MSDSPKAPPPEVVASAAVVQKWLDEQPKPGASARRNSTRRRAYCCGAVCRRSVQRAKMAQFDRSRAEEKILRKARS